jgi:hypothetical protein
MTLADGIYDPRSAVIPSFFFIEIKLDFKSLISFRYDLIM